MLEKRGTVDPKINKATFSMVHLNVGESLTIDCRVDRYLQVFDTCDALSYEFLTAASSREEKRRFSRMQKKLILRGNLHSQVSDPVVDGSLRAAGLAVSVLIAYRDGPDTYLLLKRRSEKNKAPLHGSMAHVIPSFMLQAEADDDEVEFSVTHGMYREYLEELFNVGDERPQMDPRSFYGHAHLRYLRQLLDEGQARFCLTGVAVNLLNLRPEICTLLLIDSEEWWNRHSGRLKEKHRFELNDEFARDSAEAEPTWLRRIRYVGTDDRYYREALQPHCVVPSGAAAFWLGVETLKDLQI
ncbi:hypothetical protein [Geodermatophilus tzadiensis]|nr:hypothetical protein [Geodermatophilus tzadiensis]